MDDTHQNFTVRSVVVIRKRKYLKMGKQIPADIMHHGLRRLRHNDAAHRCEKDVDQNGDAQKNRELNQLLHIAFRDRIVHRVLNQHRTCQADDAAHTAEKKSGKHSSLAAHDIDHNLFQVFKIKRGFQGFVNVKPVARQALHLLPCCSGSPRYGGRSPCSGAARGACRAR